MSDDSKSPSEQLEGALEGLIYPIRDETDLTPAFPSWSSTRFESADRTLTPRELLLLVPDDYPYETADELADALEPKLRDAGYLEYSSR